VTVPDPLAEEAQARLQATPLHAHLGIRVVRLGPQPVVIEMPVAEAALNMTGNLHGGAIATLVDVAGGMAAALASGFDPGRNSIVTADMHVRYLGRPKTDVVRAEGKALRAGRQLVVVEVRVVDTEGNLVAVSDFSSMVVPLRQPLPQIGHGDPNEPDL
jgi:uncharacterized protein (TIGR00369 family)